MRGDVRLREASPSRRRPVKIATARGGTVASGCPSTAQARDASTQDGGILRILDGYRASREPRPFSAAEGAFLAEIPRCVILPEQASVPHRSGRTLCLVDRIRVRVPCPVCPRKSHTPRDSAILRPVGAESLHSVPKRGCLRGAVRQRDPRHRGTLEEMPSRRRSLQTCPSQAPVAVPFFEDRAEGDRGI